MAEDKKYMHEYFYREFEVLPVDDTDDGDGSDEFSSDDAMLAMYAALRCVIKCAHDTKDLMCYNFDKHGTYYNGIDNTSVDYIEKIYRTIDADAQIYVKVMQVINQRYTKVLIKVYIDTTQPKYQFFFENIDEYVKKEPELICEGRYGFNNLQSEWHNQCLYEYNK